MHHWFILIILNITIPLAWQDQHLSSVASIQQSPSKVWKVPMVTATTTIFNQIAFSQNKGRFRWYCWWTKSCTTKDDDYPIIYRVLTIPGGAGFCPSTAWPRMLIPTKGKLHLHGERHSATAILIILRPSSSTNSYENFFIKKKNGQHS